ncbi:MAG: M20 family metallo-hydrolase [Bacteroidetes bacterium]|nr:M20 family metallo-hydrolase [Bacteroidota bacterium]
MDWTHLRIDLHSLLDRLEVLGQIGALSGGGVKRLALTSEDKEGRLLLQSWMKELGLETKVDQVGNMFGIRSGETDVPPVMLGSHLDTVGTGGNYDGSLGVLAALEVVEVLNENNVITNKPLAIVNYTNEEGVRFTPDMMGSLVFARGMPVEEVWKIPPVDDPQSSLSRELENIGFRGDLLCGFEVDSFLELHIEQGPILESEGIDVAAVVAVKGIHWTEYTFEGAANHAGTTPLSLRKDAGYAAAKVVDFARDLCKKDQEVLATVGRVNFFPNMPNVIAQETKLTVDLRTLDQQKLDHSQKQLDQFVAKLADDEGLTVRQKELVRFDPVPFSEDIISLIESTAQHLGYSVKKMPSGAGHDAQMMTRICPTAMIFVPSQGGISHNVQEFTSALLMEKGANVLLQSALRLLSS